MDWTAIGVGVSVVVMLGSLMLYLHSSLKEDIDTRLDRIENRLSYIERDHGERLARIEGAFQERGYWESRRTGTEQQGGNNGR